MKMTTVSNLTPASDIPLTGPMALEDAKHAWLADADHAISALAVRYHRTGRTFTADDVRKMVGAPAHGNWFGIAFAKAKNQGLIEAVAFGAARAKSRNGGSLKIWRAAQDVRYDLRTLNYPKIDHCTLDEIHEQRQILADCLTRKKRVA